MNAKVSSLSAGKATAKGIGELTAALLESEVLDWRRFKNRRQVASYTGLCPSEHSSGNQRKQGAASKHGNPRVRHQLVEAVWRLEMWPPDFRRFRNSRSNAANDRASGRRWPQPGRWPLTCGGSRPGSARRKSSDCRRFGSK